MDGMMSASKISGHSSDEQRITSQIFSVVAAFFFFACVAMRCRQSNAEASWRKNPLGFFAGGLGFSPTSSRVSAKK
jgi:hypothetical protein